MFGLQNNGNTCYFNAGIQALIHIPQFYKHISDIEHVKEAIEKIGNIEIEHLTDTDKRKINRLVTYRLYQLLNDTSNIRNPLQVHNNILNFSYNQNNSIIQPYMSEFPIGSQNDSCDVISAILRIIHDETNYTTTIKVHDNVYNENYEKLRNIDTCNEDIEYTRENLIFFGYEYPKTVYSKEYSIIKKIFCGTYINITECEICGHKNFGFSLGETLDLSIENSDNHETLSFTNLISCMDNQISTIEYSINNNHRKISGHLRAYNIMKFWQCPNTLIIRLKRFKIDNNNHKVKISNSVEIPENLNISKYVCNYSLNNSHTDQYNYSLVSAVQHSGSVNGGHYFCYSKINHVWYNFNDSSVSRFSGIPDLSQSYVLIYIRK